MLKSVNKAGRKPQDMFCEAGFKAEINQFVEKLIQRGPPKGNSLLSSQKRGRSMQPSLKIKVRKSKRPASSHLMDPSFINASKRNLTGDAFNNFVE